MVGSKPFLLIVPTDDQVSTRYVYALSHAIELSHCPRLVPSSRIKHYICIARFPFE